jgi:hypothetical protein
MAAFGSPLGHVYAYREFSVEDVGYDRGDRVSAAYQTGTGSPAERLSSSVVVRLSLDRSVQWEEECVHQACRRSAGIGSGHLGRSGGSRACPAMQKEPLPEPHQPAEVWSDSPRGHNLNLLLRGHKERAACRRYQTWWAFPNVGYRHVPSPASHLSAPAESTGERHEGGVARAGVAGEAAVPSERPRPPRSLPGLTSTAGRTWDAAGRRPMRSRRPARLP